jgi:prepilin peptidase CpaA
MPIPFTLPYVGALILAGAITLAGLMDLITMKIRNEIVIFIVGMYVLFAPLAGLGMGHIGLSLLVALGLMACTFAFFCLGWIGGGDAKLIPAIVLWLGAEHAFSYIIATVVIGGILTSAILIFRSVPLPAVFFRIPWVLDLHARGGGIPYGVAIAAGGLLILPNTSWVSGVS